ncbi:arginyltransferase [Acinetobacter tandoii]|uniref:Aspartate/glutamate leucyltransferase n=1 Tax=Acinetobacter tandoii TaxID=202954 RepID=A0A5N4W706_9GAMM|nr:MULTISPECIES: arginyltransferase [Acinetobacter]AUX86378.1 arginyltransferase [Acinetobacter sp. ACNIH2]KAB1852016.1 arginyltransferase [Acinetobacter tandoii]UOG18204.1 arginyltransferase [Acinetobacter sp. PK01]
MNSYHPKSLLNDLQYYITPPHECSYLEKKSARMVFLDPAHRIDVVTLSELSRVGFRRSGDFVYRPECHLCRQCLSCRVPVQEFQMNSKQKKAWKRNQDLTVKITQPKDASDVHYALYERYIRERHADGDMFPPSYDQFEKFLIHTCTESFFLELWKDEQLLCVSTCDQLDDGVSAVYTFFDPNENRRSLGAFAIMKQIQYAQQQQLDYVYLGYWVPHSNKMNYKSQYTPLELLLDGQWRRINRSLSAEEIQLLGNSLMTTLPSGWNNSIIK